MVKMIVAIPVFNNDVAPCFEAASLILLNHIYNQLVETSQIEKLSGCEGISRVRFLREKKVNVLICNGIKGFYRDLLKSDGISVIPDIGTTVEKAIEDFLTGKLHVEEPKQEFLAPWHEIPHEDLVCWSRDLFAHSGYKITPGDSQPAQLVDFIAEMECPVCGKSIRIAVCCGSQTYRIDKEIGRFYHTTLRQYHAQVYVHPFTDEAKEKCSEYGIELIDPNKEEKYWDTMQK
ncbi:MAG: hypothetical protein GY855_02730, partial [candidate division Zixibacteria bacterium]|nr:hypothetical protein [candidate division Zixibacteria bacterium]